MAWCQKAGERIRALGRSGKGLILCNLALWGFLALAGGTAFSVSSTNWFCSTCHVMDRAVASHERSEHGEVSCRDCHVPEGLFEAAGQKASSLGRAVAYIAGANPSPGLVELLDHRCLRCHEQTQLDGPGELARRGMAFSHETHRVRADGAPMPCVTCHNRAEEKAHMALDREACFLCHFRPGRDEELRRCILCHRSGPAEVSLRYFEKGAPFSHGRFFNRGDSCALCHGSVMRGEGARIDTTGPFEVAPGTASAAAHQERSPDQGYRCRDCHSSISHGTVHPRGAMKEEGNLPKDSPESLAFYTGVPAGEEKSPDRMFRRGVRCRACHRDDDPRTVSGESCTSCHGKGFGRLLDTQKTIYRSWVINLARGWDRYGEALGGQWSQEQAKAFEDRLALLSRGGWVHNIPVARDFVVALERKLAKATGGAFTPLLAPAWEVSRMDRACFWRCHLDIPLRKTAGARPLEIPHRRHLEKVKLRCRRCHQEDRRETAPQRHGKLKVTRTDCLRCHHLENTGREDCRTCHREQTAIMEGEGVPRAGVLRRTNCPKVQCRDCHPLVSGTHRRKDVLATCVRCHGRSREVTLQGWARAVDKKLDSVNLKLRALRPRLEGREGEAASAFFALAQKQVRWVEKDGSRGAHNVHYTLRVLDQALKNAAEAEAALGK